MRFHDWGFERLFERAFVYNILWEDTAVDEAFLKVDERSRVLAISGAGCGVANHLSKHPERIDAVDINHHHLAITALKVAASQKIESGEEFYELLGHGRHPTPEQRIAELVEDLPEWVQKYWARRWRMFRRSMMHHGLTARMLGALRALSGVDAQWLRRRIGETVEERTEALRSVMEPVFSQRLVRGFTSSPLQLLALGINFSQRDRIEATEGVAFVDYLMCFLERMAATDLSKNWFAWYGVAGHYDHDRPEALPPYLRPDHHERAVEAGTHVELSHGDIFDTLRAAPRNAWTHYTLCDAVDWMPEAVQRELFSEILRTSEDGARVLYRSVEDDSLIARHGLEERFVLDEVASDLASAQDMTRLYRRVNFYTVHH